MPRQTMAELRAELEATQAALTAAQKKTRKPNTGSLYFTKTKDGEKPPKWVLDGKAMFVCPDCEASNLLKVWVYKSEFHDGYYMSFAKATVAPATDPMDE